MLRLVKHSCVRWPATLALMLMLSAWQRLPAQDETVAVPQNYTPLAVGFSTDGKQVAAVVRLTRPFETSYQVAMLPLAPKGNGIFSTGQHTFGGLPKGNTCVSLAPDGRTWATLLDGQIDLWDGVTTKLMAKAATGPNDEVTQVLFLDRRTLIIVGATKMGNEKVGMVRLWDTKANEKHAEFNPATRVQQCHLAPDRATLTLLDGDETVRLWAVKKQDEKYELQEKATLKGHKGVICHAVSPDGKKMLTGGTDKKVRLWDVEKSKEITFLAGHADTVAWVAFTADGAMPISWSRDGTVRLWDVEADKEAKVWKREGYLSCFQISPDGKQLATGGEKGILVWDLEKMAKDEPSSEKPKP